MTELTDLTNLNGAPWPDAFSKIPVPWIVAIDILNLLLAADPQRGIDPELVRLLVNLAREIDVRDGQSLHAFYQDLVAEWCARHDLELVAPDEYEDRSRRWR